MSEYISAHRGAAERKKKRELEKSEGYVSHYVPDKNRGGLLEGTGYVAGRLGLGLAGVGEGVLDIAAAGGDLLRGDTEMAKYRFLDNRTADAQQSLTEWYNPGKGMQFAGDVASGVGQSSVFLLDALVPGLGTGLFFGGITGQSVAGAAQQTGDVGLKEIGYGVASGAAEAALGKLVGAGGKVAGKLGSSLTRSTGKAVGQRGITNALTKATGKRLAGMGWNVAQNTLADAAGEFAEEFTAEYIDTGLQRLFGIDPNASTSFGEALRAGAVGFVSGAAMGAPANVYNYKNSVAAGRAIREEGGVDQLLYRAAATVDVLKEQEEQAREKGRTKATVPEDAGVVGKTAAKGKQVVANLGDRIKASKTKGYWTKLEKNINAYTSMDEAMRNSDVGDALLGELRGNLFFTNMSYAVEEAEEALKTATDEQITEWLIEVNDKAKKAGKADASYTVEDFRANKDGILSTVAAAFWIDEIRRTAKGTGSAEKATEKPPQAPTSPWDGMADHEDMSGYKAAGEAEQALLKAAVNQGVPRGSVPAMLEQFRKGTKLTPAEFAEGWADGAHKYGRYGFDAREDGDTAFNRMEPEAREAAMKFGRETAEAEAKRADEAAKAKKKPVPKDESEAKTEGRVIKGEGLDIKELSDEQYAGYKAAELMAKALGIDIVVEKSLTDTGGMQTNGYFDKPTNTLHININARRDGQNVALYTLGHEVAHYIKAWSPAKFKVLSDFVMEQLGGEAESLIEARVKTLRKIPNFKGLTEAQLRDLAVEDVVADGMELVLTDGDVLEELSRVDKTLWEKIRDWIFDIIGQIRRSYEGLNKVSKTAQVLAETMETFDEIERLFTEAVTEAGERTKTAEYGVEIDEKTGTALFSVQDAPQNETEFNAAVDRLVDKLGVDRLRAENWVRSEMSLSALILREDMYEYAHKKADRRLTAIVKNSDYKQGTLDFSNICRKRRQYTKMMDRLQNEFPNRLFTAEDFALIRDILMEEDIEVACGLCYVEDRRQNEGYIATNFREAVQSWRAGNKATFRDSKSETDVAYSKGAAKAMEMLGKDTYVPTIAELTTVEGMAELGKEHPDVLRAWKAFNNSRGMQSSRLVTAEAEYQRQILKYSKSRVKTINDLGGLRIFSFSDFEEFHLIDIVQAVQDCAAMGIKIQFYTKVPSFAYLMKDTGAKGNMSLIPKGKLGYRREGDRVVLEFDDVEGINTRDGYFRMLSRDNPNIGTVLVGINDTQIRAAMEDPFIDYLIPYHTSQSGVVRQIKKIDEWVNYKDEQTEKWLTRAEEGEKRGSAGVNIYTDVLQAAEKEGNPITNEREFVEKFLEVCEEKGVRPRFWRFLNVDADGKYAYTRGYYKLLLDFKMFDKNGEILPQGYVTPEFDDELLTELTERYVEAEREEDTKNTAAMDRAFDQIVDRVINRNDPIYRTIKQPKAVNVRAGVDMVPTVSRVYSVEEDPFTYNKLVAKGDLEGVVIDKSQQVPLLANGNIDVKSVLDAVRSKCESVEMKGGAVTYYVNVPDIGRNVRITSDGITHGFKAKRSGKHTASGKVTARAALKLTDILKNSIEVNRLVSRGNSEILFSRVMMGTVGMEDVHGNIEYYAVRTVVEERAGHEPVLVDLDIIGNLYAAKAKKVGRQGHRGITEVNVPSGTATTYAYNIAHFLDDVKGVFDNSFSNDVYQTLGVQRNQDDFAQNLMYSVEDTETADESAFDAAVRRSGISPKATDKETQRMVKEAEKRARAAERSAERSAKSEQATKEWARETVRKTRAQRDKVVYRAKRDATEYKNAVYRRAYERADEKNRFFRENMNRKAEEARMRKEMTARKRTIMRVLGSLQTKLYNPTKTNHVPKELHDLAVKIMQTADPKAWDENRKNIREMGDLAAGIEKLERKVDRTEREQERLDAMKSKYEILESKTMPLKKQAEALYTAYKLYNETLPKDMQIPEGPMAELSKLVDTIEDKPLKEMGLESLRAVETFVKALSHQINSANDLFLQKRGEQVSDWGNAASREAAESKPLKWLSPKSMEIKNARDVRDFLWKNMKPLTVFEAIGSPKLMELFHSVLDGEEVWITDILEAREVILKAKERYKYDTWDLKTRHEFTNAEGKAVRLTVGEMMSLYAYAKREQAMGHLRGGGFVLDAGATEITEKHNVRTERRMNLTERYTMTEEDMGKLAGMLTEDQKRYADEMQDYLTSLGAKGNEISQKLYGLDLFNEKHYFPIKVKSEYLESQTGKTGDPKIKNRGMAKETVPDAENPLVLQDFMDIFNGHVNDMATYHAFVLPVEDLTRVLNYQPSNAIIDDEGNWTEDKERKEYSTLKAVIESKYGAQANAYIEQLIRDLNGGARREAAANLIDKGITAFKRASTMASLSVLVQQPTSLFRAMAYVDPKYFRSTAALDIKGHKEAWEQVKKYAKVAAIKEMGGYDTGVGTRTADYLNSKEYKTWSDRAKAFFLPDVYGGDSNYRAEIFGKGAAYADELAWIQMFDACKREQAEKLGKPMDSEEVLEAAGKRFTEVVRRTQVYDATLARSEYMRSKDTGMKMATAFMAEPTTVVSMMLDGLIRANRGDKAFLKKTAGAIAASVIFNALAVSLVYAARDDDEEKTYTEKYLATLATETAEGFNPLEYLPYTRDIMSLMKGYDIERTDMALFADLFKSFERITSSTRTPAEKTAEVAGAVASFFGVPIRNLVRDAMIPVNLVQSATSGERTTGKGISAAIADEFSVITNLFGADTTNAHELYKAAKSGDDVHYNRVASRYKTPQAAEMALRTALRENDKRIAEAAEAKISGELEAYESIIEKIESEGRFDRNLIIRAINNEVLDIKDNADQVVIPEEEVTDEDNETTELLYSTSDLNDALTRGDRKDFEDIYYYLLAVKQEQGKTEAQAKAAVKSGITSYWKKQYLAAWEENNTAEMKRILELLEGTELYGEYNDVATMASKWIKES